MQFIFRQYQYAIRCAQRATDGAGWPYFAAGATFASNREAAELEGTRQDSLSWWSLPAIKTKSINPSSTKYASRIRQSAAFREGIFSFSAATKVNNTCIGLSIYKLIWSALRDAADMQLQAERFRKQNTLQFIQAINDKGIFYVGDNY